MPVDVYKRQADYRYSQLPVIFITEPLYPDLREFYGAYTKEIS